jgi:hypothetical protein
LRDLEHYVATHGPGPDRRLARLERALAALVCGGTLFNGPEKRFVRCDSCGELDWERNEGDRCVREPVGVCNECGKALFEAAEICAECMDRLFVEGRS